MSGLLQCKATFAFQLEASAGSACGDQVIMGIPTVDLPIKHYGSGIGCWLLHSASPWENISIGVFIWRFCAVHLFCISTYLVDSRHFAEYLPLGKYPQSQCHYFRESWGKCSDSRISSDWHRHHAGVYKTKEKKQNKIISLEIRNRPITGTLEPQIPALFALP